LFFFKSPRYSGVASSHEADLFSGEQSVSVVKCSPGESLPLTGQQIYLRNSRKRLALWSLLSVVILCVCELMTHKVAHVGWEGRILPVFVVLSIFALCIQLSLVVLISCCNLSKPTRF
jgi:hypothetical protein